MLEPYSTILFKIVLLIIINSFQLKLNQTNEQLFQYMCFSSVHLTHFLQGSGQRTGMDIAEARFYAVTHFCIFAQMVEMGIFTALALLLKPLS